MRETTASASLFFAPVTDGQIVEFQPAESAGQVNQSNLFRFSTDSEGEEEQEPYIFNWDLEPLDPGNYRLKIDLDDTTSKFKNVIIEKEESNSSEGGDRGSSSLFSSLLSLLSNLLR